MLELQIEHAKREMERVAEESHQLALGFEQEREQYRREMREQKERLEESERRRREEAYQAAQREAELQDLLRRTEARRRRQRRWLKAGLAVAGGLVGLPVVV